MTVKHYKQARMLVAVYVGIVVSAATQVNNYFLALAGVITGMVFLFAVRKRTQVRVDERVISINEKASRLTYSIVVPILGLVSVLVYWLGKAWGESWIIAGTTLSYATLFILGTYALVYYLVYQKYGGEDEE